MAGVRSTPMTVGDIDDSTVHLLKQAACLQCRRSKIRCARGVNNTACKKCVAAGIDCIVPDYHVGRYKGVKNKRSGLDKAIHQIEEAVKKARTAGTGLRDEHTQVLEGLLDPSKTQSISTHDESVAQRRFDVEESIIPADSLEVGSRSEDSDQVTLNNANNPLQLLAIASAIPAQQTAQNVINTTSYTAHNTPENVDENEIHNFFSPITSKLDIGPELDPIDLGLVTMEDARMLFVYFHDKLSHTRWGLDAAIHTAEYVRRRSAFLLTAILAAAALFLPDTAALSVRLSNHCKFLARQIPYRGYRSVEIVLGFMTCIPWMSPGRSWTMDDETCYYLSTAMTIALDLSLNKIVIPSATIRPHGAMECVTQADRIEAQRALDLDGHTGVLPTSLVGRRYLRARERAWLALFSLDRGVCLARGRPWTVLTGPLLDTCDAWHVSDIADKHDGSMIASCVLRRDFGDLISSIRSTCDNHSITAREGASIVKLMRGKVEGFFAQWYDTWSFQLRQEDCSIPPYLEILVSHGKLSAYCNVINHPTASPDVKQFFRAAGLTAALEVLSVAVEKEENLMSMPNNSVIMVSFAACFVLGLSTRRRNNRLYLAAYARSSIEQAADVLERIGSSPPHRKGASALFGRHIKWIMQQHTYAVTAEETAAAVGAGDDAYTAYNELGVPPYALQSTYHDEPKAYPGFDTLTDDQLLQAIQNPTNDMENFDVGLPTEDGLFMDWLDWPSIK